VSITTVIVAIIVALVSGALGAVLGKLIEDRSERARDFRTWRLTAAADYTTGVHQALLALRNGHDALMKHGGARADGHIEVRDPETQKIRPEIERPLEEAQDRVDDAHSRLGRIHILFGAESASGRSAAEAIENLRKASQALNGWPVPDLTTYKEAFDWAHEKHDEFNREALASLEPPKSP
jgi:hypothetical protein